MPSIYSLAYTTTDEFDVPTGLAWVCQHRLHVLDEVRARKPKAGEFLAMRKENHCPSTDEAMNLQEAILAKHVDLPEGAERFAV